MNAALGRQLAPVDGRGGGVVLGEGDVGVGAARRAGRHAAVVADHDV